MPIVQIAVNINIYNKILLIIQWEYVIFAVIKRCTSLCYIVIFKNICSWSRLDSVPVWYALIGVYLATLSQYTPNKNRNIEDC